MGALVIISGCATQAGRSAPIRNMKIVPLDEQSNVGGNPDDATLENSKSSQQRVAQRLLEDAQAKVEKGQLDAAVATLERGLRIDPRNPLLWLRFAQVRLKQGKPSLAEQLANKALVLAGGARALVTESWRVILEARAARGDTQGAKNAQGMLNSFSRAD
ncbi:MAG: tetratricopeptide repeat protein [Gammaproteobacteria bacterium]|nr:tetratricopeptide repeat protein [Gammaproteobacteria bacterium]